MTECKRIDATQDWNNRRRRSGRPEHIVEMVLVAGMLVAGILSVLAPATAGAQAKPSATAQLVQRIEQLEEQIIDMQVVIGTLQSLPRSGGGAPAPSGFSPSGASDSARLDGMETQIRALSAQLAQLGTKVRALNSGGGGRRGDVGGGVPQNPAGGGTPTVTGFGSTTVLPSVGQPATPRGTNVAPPVNPQAVATRAPANGQGRGNPKKQYETAYGYLLQQQYGAAENAFADFVRSYPNDALAGNAQYWLGETFFVRGQFKPAANAFLKGYETFGSSRKASDSLLKLAMSLDRLGHKDAACSSLAELNTRFPSAPVHVKKRAASERKRVGC